MKISRFLITAVATLAVIFVASAQLPSTLSLPTAVGDNMVLQQNAEINIWGFAKPKSKVVVKPDWCSAVQTKADAEGNWCVKVQTQAASYDPHSVAITSGKEQIAIQNILFGEVWLCSGQSNMEFSVKKAIDLKKDLKKEMNSAIRLYCTGRISAEVPQNDIPNAKWVVCNAKDLAEFSAVGYGFGKELQEELNVPVGLIDASYGGTFIEGWLKNEVIENDAKVLTDSKAIKHKNWAGKNAHLYNANIYPIINTTIAGTIWYQGCANVSSRPRSYVHSLEVLINSWREEFRNPEMPFYIVQLVPHTYANIKGAQLREGQAAVANKVNHCEVVITNDQQDIPGDIHPRYKGEIAHRLAACALGEHYGKGDNFRSPAFESMTTEGDKIRIKLKNVNSKIICKGSEVIGFQIGEQNKENAKNILFHLAKAEICPDNTILVSAQGVSAPIAVRYCFNEGIGNVCSEEGLPLAPFRTDKNNSSFGVNPKIDPASQISITFKGKGYTKSTLKEGEHMWPNLKQKVSDEYPREFEGFEMMTAKCDKKDPTPGGKIVAHGDGRVYILARAGKEILKAQIKKGWRLQTAAIVRAITPEGKKIANQYVIYHDVKDGDEIDVPQIKDHYSIFILAKKIEYVEVTE